MILRRAAPWIPASLARGPWPLQQCGPELLGSLIGGTEHDQRGPAGSDGCGIFAPDGRGIFSCSWCFFGEEGMGAFSATT